MEQLDQEVAEVEGSIAKLGEHLQDLRARQVTYAKEYTLVQEAYDSASAAMKQERGFQAKVEPERQTAARALEVAKEVMGRLSGMAEALKGQFTADSDFHAVLVKAGEFQQLFAAGQMIEAAGGAGAPQALAAPAAGAAAGSAAGAVTPGTPATGAPGAPGGQMQQQPPNNQQQHNQQQVPEEIPVGMDIGDARSSSGPSAGGHSEREAWETA